MAGREVHLEHLIGRRVLARDGRSIGRLQEVAAVQYGAEFVVTEYQVGRYAAFERLSAWPIGRAILSFVGATGENGGYRVKWDKLDLSDPKCPRLKCDVNELHPLRP